MPEHDAHEIGREGCAAHVNRRVVLQGIVGLSAGMMVGSPAHGQGDPAAMPPQVGDFLVRAYGGPTTTPLEVGDLTPAGGPIEAYAMDPTTSIVRRATVLNRLTVFRFAPAELSPASLEKAADGVVAYTIICTHAACEVTDWLADRQVLECPCHFSHYNPRDNAAVLQGPATRRLPALSLRSDNGKLVVVAPFDSRVGGDVDA